MQEEITKHPDSGVSCSVEIQTKQHGEKSPYLLRSHMSDTEKKVTKSKMLHSVTKGVLGNRFLLQFKKKSVSYVSLI